MNKTCARCQKVVYPIEELKCLDKTWHKTCFKCTECGMALNMKTYKGFNKLPYCEAHIPKAKATAIADTPELKRIAENTKIQSNVKYHEDFEKAKGKFTQVADDPETLRIKQNTKIISNVAYHGDLEKKAAMEKQRETAEIADIRATTTQPAGTSASATTSNISTNTLQPQSSQYQLPINSYNQLRTAILHNSHHPTGSAVNQESASTTGNAATYAYDQQDNYATPPTRSNAVVAGNNTLHANNTNSNNNNLNNGVPPQMQQKAPPAPTSTPLQIYNNQQSTHQLYAAVNFSHHSAAPALQGTAAHHHINGTANHQMGSTSSPAIMNNGSGATAVTNTNIGKIADYDPLTDGPRPMPNTARPSTTLIYSSDSRGSVGNAYPKRIGSVADIDPANGIYGSLAAENNTTAASQHHPQQQQQQQYYQQMQMMQQQQQQQQHQAIQMAQHEQQLRQQQQHQQQQQQHNKLQQSHHTMQQKHSKPSLRVYRALYDYEAQDTDEVSFREGDVIFEVESIDSGWMTGRVERTGQTGMLPANYVEQAVI